MTDIETDLFAGRVAVTDGTCPGCGSTVPCISFGGKLLFECPACDAIEKARRYAQERRETALRQWEAVTPEAFQKAIKPDLLHPAIAQALDTDGLDGCAMIGENDTGKTRVGYALLKRCALAGKSVFAVRHSEFSTAASDRASFDTEKAAQARHTLHNARCCAALLLDDVGKGETSEKANAALYDILTHRRDKGLTTHWTANGGSKWMRQRFGADRGPAIVLRLARLAEGRIFTATATP
jgi:DNA replication protein DnaC